jgi:PIN domain nuclease of toxin-antitoxin system
VILLLDANALIWWLANDGTLAGDAEEAIRSPLNDVLVSAATVWETEIKRVAGKLRSPDDLLERIDAAGFSTLAVLPEDAIAAARLPRHHTDPFDRMVIAQAVANAAVVVSRDHVFTRYEVDVLPA